MTDVPVPTNRTKAKLAAGELCVGTMLVEVRQASIMTMLANAGFDFVLIDNEHGPFSVESVADLSRAARAEGVTPIVRIPELTYAHVAQSLDGGAQGIMLPRVVERAQVEECVRYTKYAPQGRRGAVLARGHTSFKVGPLLETISVYAAAGYVNAEAARRLDLSVRALSYRLERIAALTGFDPVDPLQRYTLETAALGARLLNWPPA